MVQQKFIRDLFWLQLLNWLIKPVWILVLENTVQNRLGEELYGSYFVVFNFSLLFTIIMDMGMNSMITRETASGHNPRLLWKSAFPAKLLLSIAYTACTLLIGWSQHLSTSLLFVVILNQMLLQWILFFRAYLQGAGKGRIDAWFSVLDRVVAIVLCLAWIQGSLFSGKEGLLLFALSQTAGYGFALILISIQVNRLVFRKAAAPVDSGSGTLHMFEVLRSSLGFALLALLMAGFTRIDALMLQLLREDGTYQAGLYARGFRLLDAGLIFPVLMSTLLLPAFTSKTGDKKELTRLAETGGVLMFLMALPAAAIGFAYAGPLMSLLNPESAGKDFEGIPVLAWLMLAYLPMSLVYVYGTLLTAMKRLRLLNVVALLAVGLNIALNLLFIPRFGALGTAWSAGLTQAFFCLNCIWFSRGALEGMPGKYLPAIFILALVCALLAWFLQYLGLAWYVQVAGALGTWSLLLITGKLHPDLHLKQFLSVRDA
ncbi:MAG: oligosaccharide flippase family protein [Bacteroidetes bacterium]|nr:oligosaccharide flippase family protein [Bacteroidota bacterium]